MDTDLVIRAQRGDQEAFADLVYAIADRFLAVSHRILSDVGLAEDATQQALLGVWQHLPELRDPARFEAWSCPTRPRTSSATCTPWPNRSPSSSPDQRRPRPMRGRLDGSPARNYRRPGTFPDCGIERMHPRGMDGRGRANPDTPAWVLEQLLTAEQRLRAVTVDAAYVLGDEARRNHLAPGTLGDVTILSGDVIGATADEVRAMDVIAPIVGGTVVYCADKVCGQDA
jgi:hypothetical protein